MIKNMKFHMLAKLDNRYSDEQMQILNICTLLDVRFKNDEYVTHKYDLLFDQLKKLEAEQKQYENQKEFSDPLLLCLKKIHECVTIVLTVKYFFIFTLVL